MSAPVPQPAAASPPITTGGQFLLLLVRSIVGYAVLVGCILLLLKRPAWTFSAIDAVFWLTLALVLFLHRKAMVASGMRAAWRGVLLGHIGIGGALWVLAQSVHATK